MSSVRYPDGRLSHKVCLSTHCGPRLLICGPRTTLKPRHRRPIAPTSLPHSVSSVSTPTLGRTHGPGPSGNLPSSYAPVPHIWFLGMLRCHREGKEQRKSKREETWTTSVSVYRHRLWLKPLTR